MLYKSAILVFSGQISGGKNYNALIYFPNAVSLAMQIRSDHLIRKVISSIF
jgi:hypothetical protein